MSAPYKRLHLCGIGGSGMLPLALILKGRGLTLSGSDRSCDQGRTPEKFAFIREQGITIFPQDGSGIAGDLDALVVSTAVEETIPDVKAALTQELPIIRRANLLAELFNAAEERVAIAGTSGKSTTTAMIGYVLQQVGKNPTVMNGAVFRNFQTEDTPYATALVGGNDLFVTEADESDGSITLYNPTIAVLNNIALDHKTMDELLQLFSDFVSGAKHAILNLDNSYVAQLAAHHSDKAFTYTLEDKQADLSASQIIVNAGGSDCVVTNHRVGGAAPLRLAVPGRHNISNALACMGACLQLGVGLEDICATLSGFIGVKRRLEVIGTKNGVTVIDDFAHNPDKIAATLATLKETTGRLFLLFQIHGYNPIRLMRAEFADVFVKYLGSEDKLFIPEVLYLGGTVDRSVTARDLVADIQAKGVGAEWLAQREDLLARLQNETRPGDRVVVMGARDDTLSDFAKEILSRR